VAAWWFPNLYMF